MSYDRRHPIKRSWRSLAGWRWLRFFEASQPLGGRWVCQNVELWDGRRPHASMTVVPVVGSIDAFAQHRNRFGFGTWRKRNRQPRLSPRGGLISAE
jgi:hypothetical protein